MKLRRDALTIFQAGLQAAEASASVLRHLSIRKRMLVANGFRVPLSQFDRVFLVAVGKAAVPMARSVEKILGHTLDGGIVVTKAGHAGETSQCAVFETGHPIPDRLGKRASEEVRALLRTLNARDLLIVAISGGASALLPAPAANITLFEKQRVTNLLLRAGADIGEVNAVRKHLSDLKGGRLAALAYPATVISLILSDVIGDRLDVIGSGLTAPDASTYRDSLTVLEKYGLMARVPKNVREHLERGARGEIAETPKPGDPIFKNVHNTVVGSNRQALEAAARTARELGYRTMILSSSLQGEAREVGRVLAEILREVATNGNPVCPPACILAGGETTVTVRGSGKGGRNQEIVLGAAIQMAGVGGALVLSAGTDGSDGPTDAAGAIATGDSISRAKRLKMEAQDFLAENDSYAFFSQLDDLIQTGPTGTNVMDIHVLLASGFGQRGS